MANKYTYSRTIQTPEGVETFTFEGGGSFDDAKGEVEKGIRDRVLELKKKYPNKEVLPVGSSTGKAG